MSCCSSEARSTSGSEMSERGVQRVVSGGRVISNTRNQKPVMRYLYKPEPEKGPEAGTGPVVIWDFDTTPFKAEHAELVICTLLQLWEDNVPPGYWDKPTILFCYTRKIAEFDYPGREQAITEVRRRIPPHLAHVRTRTTEQKENMRPYEAREELRAVMRFNIREFQNLQVPGPLMVIVSGDGDPIAWHMNVEVTKGWRTLYVIPHQHLPFVWEATRRWTHSYTWDFHGGIVGVNPKWWWWSALKRCHILLDPQYFYFHLPYSLPDSPNSSFEPYQTNFLEQGQVTPPQPVQLPPFQAVSPSDFNMYGYHSNLFKHQQALPEPGPLFPHPASVQVSPDNSFVNYPPYYVEYQQALAQPAQWIYVPSPPMMMMPPVPGCSHSPPMMMGPTQGYSQSPPTTLTNSPPGPHWREQPHQPHIFHQSATAV